MDASALTGAEENHLSLLKFIRNAHSARQIPLRYSKTISVEHSYQVLSVVVLCSPCSPDDLSPHGVLDDLHLPRSKRRLLSRPYSLVRGLTLHFAVVTL